MNRKRVLIDGFNLRLESGTGVATYARNLTYCTHEMGYETDVLYDVRGGPGFHNLLREVAFFDPLVGTPPGWLLRLRYAWETLISPVGHIARRVPITGRVISTHYKSRLPYFDTIWTSLDVF